MTLTFLERQKYSTSLKDEAYLDEKKGCWLSKRSTSRGYGQIWFRGKNMRVHRLAYAVFVGDFDDEECVLHRCDVRRCFYPGHLFLGTNADNMADRDTKGRTAKGERNGMFDKGYLQTGEKNPMYGRTGEKNPAVKLRDFQIPEIKAKSAAGLSIRRLGKEYKVSRETIRKIVNGKTWKDIQ